MTHPDTLAAQVGAPVATRRRELGTGEGNRRSIPPSTAGPAGAAEALRTRFAPILADVAAGAVGRELDGGLPVRDVRRLLDAGFGALRLPVEHGGAGARFTQLVDLLVDLARADSNLPQLLRGHVGFVELVLSGRGPAGTERERAAWLERIAAGALVGNAQSEGGETPFGRPATVITEDGSGWHVDGRKFYSTGSLLADWIYTSGRDGEEHVVALVPGAAEGVERRDDWDGFGQRFTASGSTVFRAVPVPREHVVVGGRDEPSTQPAVFQLVLLATLAGIGERALEDVVELVRGRRRAAFTARTEVPREDPQVQQVVGELAGLSFAATATVRAAAARLEEVLDAERAGPVDPADRASADSVVFRAQGVVVEHVLRLTSDLFRVGGASATARGRALDRHWRNARTVASHNPEVFRARMVGDHLLNGTPPPASVAAGGPRGGRGTGAGHAERKEP